ncbi:hypothetical protein NEUTE1DRAFT_111805 [Neurospora tetrasperma FGSC 2508]|uniref:Uncharacterized protein n=1 Tax=Neurospora tetrasperma (strain FGSC 2508 / ATCC MYA-4615 / P0657) TaxID=510951 RepID=F8MTC0_NEUT8|nr:uncharacterized protein NEUTE1DRAFT_111805 [Neurospora tetrasperma FGSC 2508]EGO55252.1 hypothetical protein NEUTE1DRAFT_111805 [Neurospora tetrasperma FGSC 2508]EGZ69529.1 hypothetical protein NEUTE2DRAFT_70183 [Neurospora tetrasperma FGSC 2509]
MLLSDLTDLVTSNINPDCRFVYNKHEQQTQSDPEIETEVIMAVTPISGLDGQMKVYSLVDQQDEDGLCTPHAMGQESCFSVPNFQRGIESASGSEVETVEKYRNIAGDEREASPKVAVCASASISANDGDEEQMSHEVTESSGDDERQVLPDAAATNNGPSTPFVRLSTPHRRLWYQRLREIARLMTPGPGHRNSENVDSTHGDSHDGLNDNADEFNADLTDGALFNNGYSDGIPDGSNTDGGVRQPDVILCLPMTSNRVMFAS